MIELEKYDLSIHTNPNAKDWAKFFMDSVNKNSLEIDEELMAAWFANAMMAVHDYLILKGMPLNGDHAAYLIDKITFIEATGEQK